MNYYIVKNEFKFIFPIGPALFLCLALIILSDIHFYFHTSISSGIYLIFFTFACFTIVIYGIDYFKADTFLMIVLLLEAIQLFFTLLNGRLSYSYIVSVIGELILLFYLNTGLQKNAFKTLQLFRTALLVLFSFDVLSILFCLFTGNFSNSEFGLAGHKNYHSFLFLAVLAINVIYSNTKPKRKNFLNVFLFILCIASEVLLSSASGFFVITFFFIAYSFFKNWRIKLFDLRIVLFGLLILNYIILFLTQTKWLGSLLKLLGRNASFTGRNVIWEQAILLIKENLLFGYGYVKEIQFYNVGMQDNHCHNFFLNLFLTGGFVYFSLFIILLFIVGSRLKKNIGKQSNIILFLISCYLLLGISEIVVNTNNLFLPILYLGWKIKSIIPDITKKI